MTTEALPPLGPAAHLRKRLTPWLQALGLILLALAVWMVVRQRDLFEQARASIAGASPWVIVAVLVLPPLNWLIVSLLFHVLANQYARVRLGEMITVIGSAWLLNVVPGRPGLMGRIAYHKVVNGMAVKDTVLLVIFGIVTNGVALLIAVCALGALVLSSAEPHYLAAAAVGVLAALLAVGWFQRSMATPAKSPIAPWRFTMAVALRFADFLVWVVRYQIAFSLIGFPIGWAESAGVAVVSQITGLLPVQLGPREWAVGVVSRFLPSVKTATVGGVARTATGLTADLLNRAAELAVSLPIGLVCTWWVYKRLRAAGAADKARN